MSKMEKENYEKSILEYADVQDAIAYARELAAEEAYGKGRKEGREEGRQAGMEKGMEKGRQEAILAIAHAMLAKGMDVQAIASITGLSEDEISGIIK